MCRSAPACYRWWCGPVRGRCGTACPCWTRLIAGAGDSGLEYESAVALLGYTPASLLDDLVEAIAARDGATAFSVVERVVATGHEPRRFVEDLLERLRDLIVLAAAGDAAGAALGMIPSDQARPDACPGGAPRCRRACPAPPTWPMPR